MAWPTHIVATGGYVFDGKGNILLVKTNNRSWDCPGGQIENGESLEEGVLREILEESGITASLRCLAGIHSNVGSHMYYDGVTPVPTKVMFDFICDFVSGAPRPSPENSETAWVPCEKAMEMITAPATRFKLEKILRFDGRVYMCSYVSRPEFKVLSDRFV